MAVQCGLQLGLYNVAVSEYQPETVKDHTAATLIWLGIYNTNIESAVFWGIPGIVLGDHSVEWSRFPHDDTPIEEQL